TSRGWWCAPSRAVSPSVSPAANRSSSVIALAIQVTSWYCTRLRSAVTSPPPPRFAVRVPPSARPYDTGPLFETTISLRRTGSSDGGDDLELGPGCGLAG